MLKWPTIGLRVETVESYEFDPNGLIPIGRQGVVTKVESVDGFVGDNSHRIFVKLDEPIDGLEDNIMSFYPECGPQLHPLGHEMTVLEWYHFHVKEVFIHWNNQRPQKT